MANKPTAKTVKELAKSRMDIAKRNAANDIYLAERREFLDKFTLCDVTCKTYIEKYKPVKKKDEVGKDIKLLLDMRVIPYAFAYFKMNVDRHILTPIFGSEKTAGRRSCKKIRDGLIHSLASSELEEMHKRYSDLIEQMDLFLAIFK